MLPRWRGIGCAARRLPDGVAAVTAGLLAGLAASAALAGPSPSSAVALGEDDYCVGSLLTAMDRLQRDQMRGLAVNQPLVYGTGLMYFDVRNDWPLLASALSKGLAAWRQSPLPALQAVLGVLDPPATPGNLALDGQQQAQLERRSVLRAGALRGRTLLTEARLFAKLRINSDDNGALRQVARVDEIPAQFHFAASQAAAGLIPLVNRALADIPESERARPYRRWVAVDFNPGFAWRGHAPWMATAGAALLLGLLASAWWMRRLGREVASRTEAEQRLRDVTNHLPGMVFQAVVDPAGQLLAHYISAGVDRFLGSGFQSDPTLPALVLAKVPPDRAAAVRAAQVLSLQTGQPFKQTFLYQHRLQGPRWLHCEATVRALGVGRLAWTGYLVDVSSERELQSESNDAARAKSLFVANASHELRAPLQTITLALNRLGAGPLDPAQRQTWRVAQEASDALASLIDDVLDLSRLDAGRVRLQPQPMVLEAELARIAAQHRLGAEARGLAFELVCQPGLPSVVSLDALRLHQLLSNLIGNAFKYTAQGKVTVTAGPLAGVAAPGDEADASGPQWLLLSVRDTGAGISLAQQKTLFEPFGALAAGDDVGDGSGAAQSANGRPLNQGARSTGLGLAICKRLVHAMHGEIMVISQPGLGTEVRVHLPIPTLAAGTLAPPGTAPVSRRGTVLMVDDDPVSRLLMAEMLRRAGYAVVEAANAEEALAVWHSQDLAAVISDRHMPGADGQALLRQIRAEAHNQHRVCPSLVLCSGDTDIAAAAELESILTKPVSLVQLTETLARLGVAPGLP